MGQEIFMYSFVAHGTLVLVEYSEFTGNFQSVAAQWLQRLPSSDNDKKFMHTSDGYNFHFLTEDGYVYGVVAKESTGNQLSFAFLERIRDDFKNIHGHANADAKFTKSVSKQFRPIMKEHMYYVIEHREEIDKVAKAKAEISQIKSIMSENVYKVMEREENINSVANKAEELELESNRYKKNAQEIRRRMWCKNMKVKFIILGILLILALILWLSICRGFNCAK